MTGSYRATYRASLVLPVILALIIPIAMGFLKPFTVFRVIDIFISCAAVFSILAAVRIVHDWQWKGFRLVDAVLRNLRPLPPAMVCGTDLKRIGAPVVTLFLIAANVFLYFKVTGLITRAAIFPPVGTPGWDHWMVSMFTSAFLHANLAHLMSNMMFLWVIGSVLESRIGPVRFLKTYFACILISQIMVIGLLWLQGVSSAAPPRAFHSLGASGAIAGLMGVFAVRCFFTRVHVTLPFLFFPLFSVPVRIPCLLLIGIFFAKDICGSQLQFFGFPTTINYWAHAGGYLGGFCLGYLLKLHRSGAGELVELRAGRLATEKTGGREAFQIYKEILAREPDHEMALKYFLRVYHYINAEKAGAYFCRLMRLYEPDMVKAAQLFREYYPCYVDRLPALHLTRLGNHFFRNCDLEKARICFKLAAEKKGPCQPRAMLYLGRTFMGLGNIGRSREWFAKVAACFPGTVFQREAERLWV